jgi:hypothetical protein
MNSILFYFYFLSISGAIVSLALDCLVRLLVLGSAPILRLTAELRVDTDGCWSLQAKRPKGRGPIAISLVQTTAVDEN